MSSLLNTSWVVLANALDPVPEPEDVNPGWIALIVVVALVAVTVLLWLSLRKQLRRVKVDDEEPQVDVRADDEEGGSNPAQRSGPA